MERNHLLELKRLTTDERPTIGVLSHVYRRKTTPLCFTVEDRFRPVKVAGDTRIPEGCYPLVWRKTGRWADRFRRMGFPGSLEITGVPGFTDVLLHVGNDKGDTEGCILPNDVAYLGTRTGAHSKNACVALYTLVNGTPGDWKLVVR